MKGTQSMAGRGTDLSHRRFEGNNYDVESRRILTAEGFWEPEVGIAARES